MKIFHEAFFGMGTTMLSVHCDGTPRSFNTELQISSTALCSSFPPNFKVSKVTTKFVPGESFGFILLIAFPSSSNVKLFVQVSRSAAAYEISVDLSPFRTLSFPKMLTVSSYFS